MLNKQPNHTSLLILNRIVAFIWLTTTRNLYNKELNDIKRCGIVIEMLQKQLEHKLPNQETDLYN